MEAFFIYEIFVFYCCLLLITRYIIGCNPKVGHLLLSFITFIPFLFQTADNNPDQYTLSLIILISVQFLFIKHIFKDVKLRYVVFSYILLNGFDIMLVTTITSFISSEHLLIELLINTGTLLLCIVVCMTKLRFRIQRILHWTPRYILVITSILLASTSFISTLIFGISDSMYQYIWSQILQTALILLQLVICIVYPLLILNSISNNHLKMLATNYEQQIQAQTEHYKNLASANYETRRFQHDFKNISIALEKLLVEGDTQQALAIVQKYTEHICLHALSMPFDSGNGIADALLMEKQARAATCNAKISFHGALPQESLSPADLCVILGNTLDNAIEACQRISQEKEKLITVNCNCSSGYIFLTISNPVSEKVSIIDNNIATTKTNKVLHGFGLFSLRSVVKKYNGEIRMHSTDDTFLIEIDMCILKQQAISTR